jgi:hypothetical protein
MEYKITYNFWKVVSNIRVCVKWMYFVKKHNSFWNSLLPYLELVQL